MKPLDFQTAFAYPFNKWKRLFYILWILVPILGILAIFGYQVRLTKTWLKGQYKSLPEFKFGRELELGFWMFLKFIPLLGAYMLLSMLLTSIGLGLGGILVLAISFFVLPMLVVNFLKKETVESSFDLDVVRPVYDHLEDYIIAVLKSLGLAAVWIVLMIVLVGLPANTFTKNIFIVDFYRRRVKK